ncbi:MAG: SulP family inorganic anion transporter [Chloroflexi bacterium]|nr:SulP family inorganic anion transporter [Chloroflexota bacterium]
MTLASVIVAALITALFSSDHTTQAIPQSPTAVIQGTIAASVIAAAPAEMSEETLFMAVFLITLLSAMITGGVLFVLGIMRAGGLIRYIPYPIVGGFMAGVGWLVFNAGFIVLFGLRLNAESLPVLFESEIFARWLPALVFALSILGLRARVKSTLILPGGIIVSLVLFYVWLHIGLGDANTLAEAGWFLPEMSAAINWQLPDFAAMAQIDPAMIEASAGGIVTLVVVCALNLFFRASAQELIIDRELDINRECAVNGIANIAAGASGGGILAYHGLISTALVEAMRIYGRLFGVILALMFLLTLLFGSALFSLVPRFIPAGLMMYFGLQFMKEWLWDSRPSLPRRDYAVVIVIALTTALLGLLPGIALGLVVAIAAFVLEYSRMDVIKQEFSGRFHRSNLDRSFAQNQLLQSEGDKILIFRLQGYIFFGSAYRFYEHLRTRITGAEGGQLRFIILDFKAVRGLDVSTIVDFQKLKKLTDGKGIELLIANAAPHLQPLLLDSGIVKAGPDRPALFSDRDHALEWCENALLREAALLVDDRVTVEQQLSLHSIVAPQDARAAQAYLERMGTRVGEPIFNQGDESDALYFIESGRVDVLLRDETGQALRLRSMTAGAVIGEVGFYLGKARSASIVVTEAGVLQRLNHEALRRMEEEAPQTASAIHVLIASLLSDRLSTTNRLVQELMD